MMNDRDSLEWEIEEINVKNSETSFNLLINPFIIDNIIEFYLFEYPDKNARDNNYSLDLGINKMSKGEFEEFKKFLEEGDFIES